jgi:hypothetical protein
LTDTSMPVWRRKSAAICSTVSRVLAAADIDTVSAGGLAGEHPARVRRPRRNNVGEARMTRLRRPTALAW